MDPFLLDLTLAVITAAPKPLDIKTFVVNDDEVYAPRGVEDGR